MSSHNDEPLLAEIWRKWYPKAAEVPDMELLVNQWDSANIASDRSVLAIYRLREWYAQGRQGNAPDIVQGIAHHGYSRLLTREWKELPLEPFFDEAAKQYWRSVDVEPTLLEFRNYQAEFVGGLIETLASNSDLFYTLINQQLNAKLTELRRLANLPLEEYYTPQNAEDDDDIEYLSELNAMHRDLAAPFKLRQQLACFVPGFEVVRANMLDFNPDLNLPDIDLFNASTVIDLGAILRTFDEVDPQLKAILRNYAKHDYFELEDPVAPETFWWRHQRSRPRGHKSQRGRQR